MTILAVLTMGILCTSLTVWARAGRSELARWWPGSQPNEAAIICVMPALGLCGFMAAILAPLEDDSVLGQILVIPVIFAMLWGVYGVFGFPIPRRCFPAWAWEQSYAKARIRRRERKRRERRRAAREKPDG